MTNVILLVGTYDTKQDELDFLAGVITQAGGRVLKMDVSRGVFQLGLTGWPVLLKDAIKC